MLTQFLIGTRLRKTTEHTPALLPLKSAPPAEEQQLLSAVLSGDQQACNTLVRRYRKMVLNIALGITGSREDAEEAVQDTFVRAFRYLPAFRGDSSFKTWLYRVARTTALDHQRRKRMKIVSSDAPGSPVLQIPEPGSNSLQSMMRAERADSIRKAMGQLSSADEAALQLFYFHDQSIEEISMTMGWTASNTKSRLSRARQRLRAVLGEGFVAEAAQ